MTPRFLATVAVLIVPLGGCQDYTTPSQDTGYALAYPNGAVADLPHLNPGAQVMVAVQVNGSRGKPVAGVEVVWDDGFVTPSMRPRSSLSDTAGLARTLWIMRPLPVGTFAANRVLRAYLPGADHNPLEYRIEVVPCGRPPCPG